MVFLPAAVLSAQRPVAAQAKPSVCRQAVIEGELVAGKELLKPIGNGLVIFFQPIASGWILRVLPREGPVGEHDYAELATPPYKSVSPLSISTDFAFRAQDAVGWNPRRFRFATSAAMFKRLEEAYSSLEHAGATPPAPVQVELADQISRTSEGTLTIVDAHFTPGMANQWRAAAAVSSHLSGTAHTLFPPADGTPTPLGKLLWLRVRLTLDLPRSFQSSPGVRVVPHVCGGG